MTSTEQHITITITGHGVDHSASWTDTDGAAVELMHLADRSGLGEATPGLVSTISGYGEAVALSDVLDSPDYPDAVKSWARETLA